MPVATRLAGSGTVTPVRNDYSGTNVTTAAYVQLVAATSANTSRLQIFDSSGSALVVAFGAAASEVDQFYIPPGGAPFTVDVFIPKGTRVSIKAVDANATSGQLLISFLT